MSTSAWIVLTLVSLAAASSSCSSVSKSGLHGDCPAVVNTDDSQPLQPAIIDVDATSLLSVSTRVHHQVNAHQKDTKDKVAKKKKSARGGKSAKKSAKRSGKGGGFDEYLKDAYFPFNGDSADDKNCPCPVKRRGRGGARKKRKNRRNNRKKGKDGKGNSAKSKGESGKGDKLDAKAIAKNVEKDAKKDGKKLGKQVDKDVDKLEKQATKDGKKEAAGKNEKGKEEAQEAEDKKKEDKQAGKDASKDVKQGADVKDAAAEAGVAKEDVKKEVEKDAVKKDMNSFEKGEAGLVLGNGDKQTDKKKTEKAMTSKEEKDLKEDGAAGGHGTPADKDAHKDAKKMAEGAIGLLQHMAEVRGTGHCSCAKYVKRVYVQR